LALVPKKYDSPNGSWVGVSARVSVIVYNTRELRASQLPRSIMDLADRQWRGKVGIAPTETDFQPIVASVLGRFGQRRTLSWLESLKTNAGSHSYADNETLVAAVNNGDVALGVINQYYWYRLRAEIGRASVHSAIAYFAPQDPGYVVDVSGAGVLSSSTHQRAAQEFVAFLVSRAGQQIIASSDSFEYPIGSRVVTRQPETPLTALRPNPISIGELGDGARAIALLSEAGLT
jgi:iron(III) transport system substrate-binding protein